MSDMGVRESGAREKPQRMETDEAGNSGDSSDDEGTTIENVRIPPAPKIMNVSDSGKRIIITKITINGFKSYGKKQVLGPFHKCFNSVVGPNGSGKSNVIDAILFVFGYRAKQIRSKNVSVLVHHSAVFPNIQSCKVTVHFSEMIDNPDSDECELVPNTEFTVSRIGNRDNSSHYELRGRKVQFKEVSRLLLEYGIDLVHNRFLILQGEVEQIAMMKCKGTSENETGMLEYLEDIIGTSRLIHPIQQLCEKLDHLKEIKLRCYNRLQIVENDVEGLKEPMQETINYLRSENKLITLENLMYQKSIFDAEDEVEEWRYKLNQILPEHEELIAKIKQLSKDKAQKDEVLKKATEDRDNLMKRQSKLKLAFEKVEKKDVQLQADSSQINTNRKKFINQLGLEKKKLLKIQSDLENNAETITECEKLEQKKLAERTELEQSIKVILNQVSNSTKDLQLEKLRSETELTKLQETVNKTKKSFGTAEEQLALFYSSEEGETKKLDQLKAAFDTSREEIAEKTRLVSEFAKSLPDLESSLKTKTKEIQNLKNREQLLLNDLKSKRIVLEENRANMQSSKSKSKVLNALLDEKRQGRCPGLHGRLGDLGAIDKKYDVAISTACGPLDNIVVDTMDTAQHCVEFLKRHDIGRATFIALEKQEHLRNRANSTITTPENVSRLFDLVQISNDDFRTAFYYALGDTLVAQDLDQATRIGYGSKRHRVVTLRGDLIETSGIMSGGGNTVSRGRMGQQACVEVDPKTLNSLEIDVNRLENALTTLRAGLSKNEAEVPAMHSNFNEMKLNFEKYSQDLKFLQQQLPELQQRLRVQQAVVKECKVDENDVKALTREVEGKKKVYEEAKKKAEELKHSVDKLTEEIHAETLAKTEAINEKLDKANEDIKNCKQNIIRYKVSIETGQKKLKSCESKIRNLEDDLESALKTLEDMVKQREEIESDGNQLLKCIDEIQSEIAKVEGTYTEIKEEVEELLAQVDSLKKKKLDMDLVVKDFNKKIDECNSGIHQWHAQLSRLKLQMIPGEDEAPSLPKFSRDELSGEDLKGVKRELAQLSDSLKKTKPNLLILDEYKEKMEVYAARREELMRVTAEHDSVDDAWDRVKTMRKDEFLAGFHVIRSKLKEIYQLLSIDGDADLELVDSFNPFTEGVELNIRPPQKSWKRISQLSGGEKTLSSLALVFALHHYKPSPLYIMDEIDAALDFKNVAIVGQFIKRNTKNTQFIIISLRSEMCELSDLFIGIYKPDNFTLTVCVDPKLYQKANESKEAELEA